MEMAAKEAELVELKGLYGSTRDGLKKAEWDGDTNSADYYRTEGLRLVLQMVDLDPDILGRLRLTKEEMDVVLQAMAHRKQRESMPLPESDDD